VQTSRVAYERFGVDSDVYVFLDVHGYFRCMDCSLSTALERFMSTASIVEHLRTHVAAGDRVPTTCFDDLANDRDENDLWIEDLQAGRANPD
jgi:hypothetical protein